MMSIETTISSMSTIERIQAMELLWDALSHDTISSPVWHEEILCQRRKRVASGETTFISLEQLRRSYRS